MTNIKPEFAVALSSAVWGLLWIPLRAFEAGGLAPGWVIVCQFAAPLLFLAPLALWQWRGGRPYSLAPFLTGFFVGGGVVLYSESLLQTSVARALILFYIMPAWGTLVEVGWMGRRFTAWRGLALLLSIIGLIVLLGLGGRAAFTFNLGDGMALASGLIFTLGAMRVREAPDTPVFDQLLAFFLCGSLVALGIALLPIEALGQPPTLERLVAVGPWILLTAAVLIPVMWGLYWGSRFVDPGRLGILLQLEAVIGIGSAALLAGDPFGWREALGAVLVIGAGLVELWGNRAKIIPSTPAKNAV